MNKNEIYIKSGTNYKEMTKELLAQCGLASVISDKKMQIGIKPNLVSPSEASWGATTHPEIVAGIIEYLQENGYGNIAILVGVCFNGQGKGCGGTSGGSSLGLRVFNAWFDGDG